jgi:hypothetical protein
MKVTQIAELVNGITEQVLGKSAELTAENMKNIVDIGTQLTDSANIDNYVRSLADRIGKVIFVDRPYSGSAPAVFYDSWDYGSILEKISAEMPNATINETWELTDGKDYSQDVFHKPVVSSKFFNKRVTFECEQSYTEKQVKSAFISPSDYNAFLTMLHNSVEKSMTIKIDGLISRTINNMIAETIKHNFSSVTDGDYSKSDSVTAVNLLKQYNGITGKALTVEKCFFDSDFLRYSAFVIKSYIDKIRKISTLFNIGGKDRFTPSDKQMLILHSGFASCEDVYLSSDVYHNEIIKIPNYSTVPFWQSSGKDFSNSVTTAINVQTNDGTEINISGIVGVLFDHDALGVTCTDRRVNTYYNAKAEFFNNFYKFDSSYFNDLNENFVVFFIA